MVDCYFCNELATTFNIDKVEVCRKCKQKFTLEKCPACNDELVATGGKFGAYFKCWTCNKNWSKRNIQRFK